MRWPKFFKKQYLYTGAFFSALLLFIFFSGKGLMQIYQLREEREKIKMTNIRLGEENRKLAEQIEKIRKNSQQEIEKIVRDELGLVKKGEIIYKFE